MNSQTWWEKVLLLSGTEWVTLCRRARTGICSWAGEGWSHISFCGDTVDDDSFNLGVNSWRGDAALWTEPVENGICVKLKPFCSDTVMWNDFAPSDIVVGGTFVSICPILVNVISLKDGWRSFFTSLWPHKKHFQPHRYSIMMKSNRMRRLSPPSLLHPEQSHFMLSSQTAGSGLYHRLYGEFWTLHPIKYSTDTTSKLHTTVYIYSVLDWVLKPSSPVTRKNYKSYCRI